LQSAAGGWKKSAIGDEFPFKEGNYPKQSVIHDSSQGSSGFLKRHVLGFESIRDN